MRLESPFYAKQLFTLLLGGLLSLAIFISPYQLHNNPASIFAKIKTGSHQHHQPTSETTQTIKCLRCVLQGFGVPEIIVPFIFIVVVLGFLVFEKPSQPFSFITLSKRARPRPSLSTKYINYSLTSVY